MYTLQRNEPVVFFDGKASIQATFRRRHGNDAVVKIIDSPVSVYEPGEEVTVPYEALLPEYSPDTDDGSLDLNEIK